MGHGNQQKSLWPSDSKLPDELFNMDPKLAVELIKKALAPQKSSLKNSPENLATNVDPLDSERPKKKAKKGIENQILHKEVAKDPGDSEKVKEGGNKGGKVLWSKGAAKGAFSAQIQGIKKPVQIMEVKTSTLPLSYHSTECNNFERKHLTCKGDL